MNTWIRNIEEADATGKLKLIYHLPYGPLGWLYGKLVLEARMRRHLNRLLWRMKRLSENPLAQDRC